MDLDLDDFASTYQRFLEVVSGRGRNAGELTELGAEVQEFLGTPLEGVDPVVETFPAHQVVDIDLALEKLRRAHDGRLIGIRGPHKVGIDSFGEFLERTHFDFRSGGVSYVRTPTGPDSDRRVVSLGVALVRYRGQPVVWLQRSANPQYGRNEYGLEVLTPDPALVPELLAEVRASMEADSVLRGQVISFQRNDFDYHAPGGALTFVARPEVGAEQVILPDGELDRIVGHVIGIGEQRERLLAAGQHLKRGVLLYGPPGTGKTHVIRHLISRTPGTTVVLLSGRTLGLVPDAARLARAAQPAIVVLEDCDLIAEERGGDTNAALFETLEALDGIDGDADVTFILTTNRADLLERALAERPGRVDLAVEIAKPDLDGRRRLLDLYAGRLPLAATTLQTAAEQTEGVTASFAKELVRRVVLRAAREDREPADADLITEVAAMRSDAEQLTRVVLGSGEPSAPRPEHDDDPFGAEVRAYPDGL